MAKVFVIALILDVICRPLVLRFAYPGFVVFALALLPYLLIRGPANHILRSFRRLPRQDRNNNDQIRAPAQPMGSTEIGF
jgi:hypothetical protein